MKTEAEKRTLIINALLYAGELQPVDFDALVGQESPLQTVFAMALGMRVTWYAEGYCKILAALIEDGTVLARYDEEAGWFYSLAKRQSRYLLCAEFGAGFSGFKATIVDTHVLDKQGNFTVRAECYDLEHAGRIVEALNRTATK